MKKTAKGKQESLTAVNSLVSEEIELEKRIAAFYDILCDIFGTERVILKANKLEALGLIRSDKLGERVLGLQKLVMEDPTLDQPPREHEIAGVLANLEMAVADVVAHQALEEKLDRLIAERMQERHEEYFREVRDQILRESAGVENAQTLKKLAVLEVMDQVKLAKSASEILRPSSLEEIVGQQQAVTAIISKLISPYPQHMILYGPPGVGKTTAARLALETVKNKPGTPFDAKAPFIEVDGTTLRWDPRDITNPLLGSVHDPIYQGAKRDLADTGVPEPKMGLVSEAHGGILFIDEIGEMDPLLLNKLLKVLEDKRVHYESSYYDPDDPNVPRYIKKIFEEGIPADFVLIGATTREPAALNPALRSRCAEIYFEPLTPQDIQEIVIKAADKLGAKIDKEVPKIISDYTIEGRKANNILSDAYGLALYQKKPSRRKTALKITKDHVYQVVQMARLSPYTIRKSEEEAEVGRIFGLGVAGFVGSVIEIEAVALAAREKGKGKLRFNDTAGSMAKDSVFNAASVVRKMLGAELEDYDLHINVIGGGNIDGPSAGVAICLALLSVISGQPLRQDVAVTGELSLQGKIKPVGGIVEKIYGAKLAGMKKVLVPKDNEKDVPQDLQGIEVVIVSRIEEALKEALAVRGPQVKKQIS